MEELDYGLEADNASEVRGGYGANGGGPRHVKVPHVFRGLSGRCVLTQEWVTGRKLTEITADPTSGPMRAKLVQAAAEQLHGAVSRHRVSPRGSAPG